MCKEIFDGAIGGEEPARIGLLSAVFDGPYPDPHNFIGVPPKMHDVHLCKNGDCGVGDLLGFHRNE